MLEPLPFDDDLRADALAAFDGLVRALAGLAQQRSGGPGLSEQQLDEAHFRLVDLLSAALEAAGVEDGLARLEAFSLMSETLLRHFAVLVEQELDEAADEVATTAEAGREVIPARVSRAPGSARPVPWGLPLLSAWTAGTDDQRN